MPTALISRDTLALQSWRDPRKLQQNRPKSSIQQARVVDERTSAILHSDQRPQHLGSRPESLSNTSSQSQVLSRTSEHKERSRTHRESRHTRLEHPRSNHERRANKSSRVRPTQRRRGEPGTTSEIELKDENYLRSHMHVPKALEYPEIPPTLFEFPKTSLIQAFGGRNKIKPVISQIGRGQGFRCTLKFNFNQQEEVCIGESRSQVLYRDRQSLNKF